MGSPQNHRTGIRPVPWTFPICGGGDREPRIIIGSDVGEYGTKKYRTRWTDRLDGGDQSIAMAVGGGGIGINPHSPPSDDEFLSICTAEPKARQQKGLDNL